MLLVAYNEPEAIKARAAAEEQAIATKKWHDIENRERLAALAASQAEDARAIKIARDEELRKRKIEEQNKRTTDYVKKHLWHDPKLDEIYDAKLDDYGYRGGRIRRKSKTNGRKPITHKIKNLKKFNI